jgi:hypothetical protein
LIDLENDHSEDETLLGKKRIKKVKNEVSDDAKTCKRVK